jgi:tetratricopeptide (TPR) repeat protein
MPAKRKTPAKKAPRRSLQPEFIRLKEFLQIFHDTDEYAPDRSFCFILGAGASFTAGIPTGASLVDRWLVEMHDADDACTSRILPPHATIETFAGSLLPGEEERLKKWSETKFAAIPGYTFAHRAAYYGQIYKARFWSDPTLGQLFLRKLIHRRPPSIGFHLLARILNRTRHRIVVTTNFDHLVEDAIAITENEAIQSYNHEQLAGFLSSNSGHPAIAKIHGDILLRTFNAEEELESLNEQWTPALRDLFQTHTPIIIGYGGNDPGFMDFLIREMKAWPAERRCYWFVRKAENFPKIRKSEELAGIPALRLVECPGFTELMILLDESLGYDPLDKELREKTEQIAAELATAQTKAKADVDKHQKSLLSANSALLDSFPTGETSDNGKAADNKTAVRSWREWRDVIRRSARKDKKALIGQAMAAHPGNLALEAQAAYQALGENPSDDSRMQDIEQCLQRAEILHGPEDEITLFVMHYLGLALLRNGQYSEGETLFRRLLAERRRILGSEHLDVISSYYNLSLCLEAQGRKGDALFYARKALAGSIALNGEEHRSTQIARRQVEDLEKP